MSAKSDFDDKSVEWLRGYLSACYNFGVWKDGEILLGCGMTKYKNIKEQIKNIIKQKSGGQNEKR